MKNTFDLDGSYCTRDGRQQGTTHGVTDGVAETWLNGSKARPEREESMNSSVTCGRCEVSMELLLVDDRYLTPVEGENYGRNPIDSCVQTAPRQAWHRTVKQFTSVKLDDELLLRRDVI